MTTYPITITAPATITLPGPTYASAADYPTIQAALDAHAGGCVYVPKGVYTEQLTIPSSTTLRGDGAGTVIRAPVGSTGAVVTTAPNYCTVCDLSIEAPGIDIDGLLLVGPGPNEPAATFDAHHQVSGVLIRDVGGSGLVCQGNGSNQIVSVTVLRTGRYGFVTNYDNTFVACLSGESGLSGFFINGSSARLVGCKAWWAGEHEVGVDAYGFYLSNCRSAALAACEAQDNGRAGFHLYQTQHATFSACVAESNGRGGGDADVGYDLWNSRACRIDGMAWNREERSTNPQRYALRFRSGCHGNSVQLISDHPGQPSPLASNSDDTAGNRVDILHNGSVWLA